MTTYKDYYQVLDELRLSNKMTISKLCEDIISERTYYRNLQSNEEIKFKTFAKLLERLGLELPSFVHYAMYFRSGDPGIGKFVYRVYAHHFHDVEPIYHSVQMYKADNKAYGLVVKAFIKKYEYQIAKITKEEYINELEAIIINTDKELLNNIYIVSIYALYIEITQDNELVDIEKICNHLIAIDFRLNPLFYVISLNYILYTVVGSDLIDEKMFRDLVKRLMEMLQFFGIKVFLIGGALYTAYIHYLDNNEKLMNEFLLIYATNLSILYGGEEYQIAKKKVESLFKIDYDAFIIEQSKQAIRSKRFNIIK